MGKVSLKVLEKSMNFLFQKGYKPCNQKHYPDLGSDVVSMEFLHSFLRPHFAKKSVVVL